MRLTDDIIAHVKRKNRLFKITDGGALYIEVPVKGSLRWRYKYRFQGRENRLSLGLWPQVSVMQARSQRDKIKDLIKQGVNPSMERKKRALSEPVDTKKDTTFSSPLDKVNLNPKKFKGQINDYKNYIAELKKIIINAREDLRKIG